MTDVIPAAGPGGERDAKELEDALRRAGQARRQDAEIAADDGGASATAETDESADGSD